MSSRRLFIASALFSASLLAAAYYFQYGLGLEPCPRCILQRIAVFAFGLLSLIVAIHNPNGWILRSYAFLASLFATMGLAIAGRHVWLQGLDPDEVPACGPGLEYIMDTFPLSKAMDIILRGSGECADISWQFIGLSMPAWMAVIFIGFLIVSLAIMIKPQLILSRLDD